MVRVGKTRAQAFHQSFARVEYSNPKYESFCCKTFMPAKLNLQNQESCLSSRKQSKVSEKGVF